MKNQHSFVSNEIMSIDVFFVDMKNLVEHRSVFVSYLLFLMSICWEYSILMIISQYFPKLFIYRSFFVSDLIIELSKWKSFALVFWQQR